MRLALACCVLLLSVSVVRGEDAPEKQRARQLLQQGNALYANGDFKGALQLFRQAYGFFPSPKLLLNTAACEKEIGRRDHAASDLAEFLRQYDRDRNPPPEQHTLAEQARLELEVLAPDLGRIIVEGTARDAIIEIDGEETWRRTYVEPGEHVVRLREAGEPVYETHVKLAADKTVTVRRATSAPPAPVIETPAVAAAPASRPREKKRPAWVIPVAVVGGVVVLGVALGVGLGVGLHHDGAELDGVLGKIPFSTK